MPAAVTMAALSTLFPVLCCGLPVLAAGGFGGASSGAIGAAGPAEWVLLFVYLGVALGFSFLCSMLEATILSLPRTHIAVMVQQGSRAGSMLLEMRREIDTPLAAILTLNTFAHTVGAAGAGAQVSVIFGGGSLVVAAGGVVITLLILYLSEIIPKSLGAIYSKQLAVFAAYTIRLLIWVSYPFVVVANQLSRLLGGGEHHHITREEVAAVADMGEHAGVLQREESRVIRNLLRLTDVKVSDVMTPRSVVFMLQKDTPIADVVRRNDRIKFSRIPVYDASPDQIVGLIQRHELFRAARDGRGQETVGEHLGSISVVPETASVGAALNQFVQKQEHLFQVVDEFGGTAGIITLEDCVETLLGVEIVDETDSVRDMRELARQVMNQRRAQRMALVGEAGGTEPAVAGSATGPGRATSGPVGDASVPSSMPTAGDDR